MIRVFSCLGLITAPPKLPSFHVSCRINHIFISCLTCSVCVWSVLQHIGRTRRFARRVLSCSLHLRQMIFHWRFGCGGVSSFNDRLQKTSTHFWGAACQTNPTGALCLCVRGTERENAYDCLNFCRVEGMCGRADERACVCERVCVCALTDGS